MPSRGQALVIAFTAWNTEGNAGEPGDSANINPRWIKDGILTTPTNTSPAEKNAASAPGEYTLTFTGAECTCNTGKFCGNSSTTNVAIIPQAYTFEQALPLPAPDAAGGLPISDAGGLNTDGISSAVWAVAARTLTAATGITNTGAQIRLDGADHTMVNTTGIITATSVTVSDKTGFSLSTAGVNTVCDQVWDELIADHTGATTFGGKNQKAVPSETIADYRATGFSIHSAADVGTTIWAKAVDVANFASTLKILLAANAGETTVDNTNKVVSYRDQSNTAVVFNTTFGGAGASDSVPRAITNTVIQ